MTICMEPDLRSLVLLVVYDRKFKTSPIGLCDEQGDRTKEVPALFGS
jgi:hypothetical protein